MMFQYYVKIVPTTYTSVTGKVNHFLIITIIATENSDNIRMIAMFASEDHDYVHNLIKLSDLGNKSFWEN